MCAGIQTFSTVTVQCAAETSAGIGPYSNKISAITEQDGRAGCCIHYYSFIHSNIRSSICTNVPII